ncbi:MAG: DUF3419 family protein [Parachlamydiaceae bacterium]|nr:DUF3419 family protein [Parachlamydiaceae bacterium]
MSRFFKRLNYSIGNEDWETEHLALRIQPNDHVVCVTASGDRPLNILLDDPKEVLAIDLNPSQNYLLDLKMAAMRELDYDHYLSFLGVGPNKHREECLKKITKHMHRDSNQYWLKNKKLVSKGVLYQGRIEKWTDKLSKVFQLVRGSKIKQLFEFDNLEEQRIFVKKHWDTYLWRKTFEIGLNPFILKNFLNDPGLNEHLDFYPGIYLCNRFNDGLMNYLAKESLLLSLVFKGKAGNEAYTPYLTENGFNIIRTRLDRITFKNKNIIQFLEESTKDSFDAFSLSDVASYINVESFHKLLHGVQHSAKSGARFSIREFMSRRSIPEHIGKFLTRDPILEKKLEKQDRCFIYSFMTGTVKQK